MALGEALREAHRTLDGARLRELGRRQRTLVDSLSAQARRLTAAAGRPVGDDVEREVAQTLHTVLADPEAARQWATGRLSRPPQPVTGFPGLAPGAAERLAAPPAPTGAERPGAPARVTDLARARERRRREDLARAREHRREAERRLRTREKELERARDEEARARQARTAAGDETARLTAALEAARAVEQDADRALRRAEERLREAEQAAAEADRSR